MHAEDRQALKALIEEGRQAALGTLDGGSPFVSMVLYALEQREQGLPALLIHISRLAAHTRHLFLDPRASLLIMRPDVGEVDPQTLGRVTIKCMARPVHIDDPTHCLGRAAYLAHLPEQAYLFNFPDFTLFRLEPQEARYIGGFGKAFTLDARRIGEALGPATQ